MKYCVGPMTKNVTDTVIDYCNKNNVVIGLIPSRRQVEYNGGYVNNWNTYDFCKYVKERNKDIPLIRDHGGPNQGLNPDDGKTSMAVDSVCFDGIHVDIWKKHQDLDEAIEKTCEYIKECVQINEDVFFEIGTEQSIRKYEPEDLDRFLNGVEVGLGYLFSKVKYAVVQAGTSLNSTVNTGNYDGDRLTKMLEVCKSHNLLSKEHNGDYVSQEEKNEKFALGLDCINIAPEFGVIETECILSAMGTPEIDKFFELCFNSKKWVKWVSGDFKPHENKIETIKICGHYLRSNKFIVDFVNENGIDENIVNAINVKLAELHGKKG